MTALDQAIQKLHRTGVGGSMAAPLAGLSRWSSPFKLYQQVVGELPPDPESEPMYWGKALEPHVVRRFTRETGIKVVRPGSFAKVVVPLLPDDVTFVPYPGGFAFITTRYGFPMIASLDAVAPSTPYGVAAVEAKTANAFKSKEWEEDEPIEYYVQAQHYLAVTGWRVCYVPAVLGGQAFVLPVPVVERNEAVIDALVAREREFWCEHVLKRVPPEIDGSEATSQTIKALYPHAAPEVVDVIEDASLEDMAATYRELGTRLKCLESERETVANILRDTVGEREGFVAGRFRVTWKEQTRASFDPKALKADYPDLVQQYTRNTTTRSLRVSEEKP